MSASSRVDRVVAALSGLACVLFLATIPGSTALRRSAAASTAESPSVLYVVAKAAVSLSPLRGAAVRVFRAEGDRFAQVAEGSTDAQGQVAFPRVQAGVVWVLAEAEGRARASTQLYVRDDARSIEFRLEPGSSLRVRVEDDRGAPIDSATVLVSGGDALPFGALTRADGSATLDRLGRGPYRVRAAARGYEAVTRPDVASDVTIVLRPLAAFEVTVKDEQQRQVPGATVVIAGPSLWPARRAVVNDQGRALISGLESGVYDLKAAFGTKVSRTHVGVQLERGEQKKLTLTLGAGRMVTALVTDGEEDPPIVVANADVVLVEGGLSSFPMQGRTDTFGKVVLGPIAPGPAVLAARADGFVARSAVVVPDEVTEPVKIPLLRGAKLRGEVVDARGRGVDGATIEVIGTDLDGLPIAETPTSVAFQRSHFDWALSGPAPLIPAGELGVMPGPIPPIPGALPGATALAAPLVTAFDPWVTRYDGSFVAQPIPPGRVRALVRHPAYVEALSEAVTLAPGGEGTVKVVLSPGGALEGRVVDAHDIPVAGVRVDVVAVVGTVQRSTITSTDGTFAFAAVPAEITVAIARPEDLSRIVHRETVSVPEGQSVEVEVVLAEPRGEMAILVESESGAPVPMAQVSALSLDTASPLRETRFTDDEGKVAIPDAQGLALRLIVEASGYARSTRVLPAAPESLTLSLVEGVLVEGVVTAVRGRTRVPSATVTLSAAGQSKSAHTDEDGRYVLRDVSPGNARLRVTHPDYAEIEVEVAIRATGRADRAFEVEPVDLIEAGSASGTVFDANGKAVSGARVAIGMVPAYLPLGALPAGMAKTNASGKFVIEGVHPGTVAIEAYAVEVGRGHADRVVVEAGRRTENVEIRLTEPADDTESAAPATVAITLADRVAGGYVETVILHVAAGSEAERGGLVRGDVLLEVDGIEPDSLDRARQLLSGLEGSDVVVIVERKGSEVPLRIRRERVRR